MLDENIVLTKANKEKDREIEAIKQVNKEKNREIEATKQANKEKDHEIEAIKQVNKEKDREIEAIEQAKKDKAELAADLQERNRALLTAELGLYGQIGKEAEEKRALAQKVEIIEAARQFDLQNYTQALNSVTAKRDIELGGFADAINRLEADQAEKLGQTNLCSECTLRRATSTSIMLNANAREFRFNRH